MCSKQLCIIAVHIYMFYKTVSCYIILCSVKLCDVVAYFVVLYSNAIPHSTSYQYHVTKSDCFRLCTVLKLVYCVVLYFITLYSVLQHVVYSYVYLHLLRFDCIQLDVVLFMHVLICASTLCNSHQSYSTNLHNVIVLSAYSSFVLVVLFHFIIVESITACYVILHLIVLCYMLRAHILYFKVLPFFPCSICGVIT